MARERRRSRIALRRAGIGLHAERGESVVLRRARCGWWSRPSAGPSAQSPWPWSAPSWSAVRVDPALAALLCATVVGICVRLLLGGVSRAAGLIAPASAWARPCSPTPG